MNNPEGKRQHRFQAEQTLEFGCHDNSMKIDEIKNEYLPIINDLICELNELRIEIKDKRITQKTIRNMRVAADFMYLYKNFNFENLLMSRRDNSRGQNNSCRQSKNNFKFPEQYGQSSFMNSRHNYPPQFQHNMKHNDDNDFEYFIRSPNIQNTKRKPDITKYVSSAECSESDDDDGSFNKMLAKVGPPHKMKMPFEQDCVRKITYSRHYDYVINIYPESK
jgi:ribosomal protein L22